MADSAPLGYEKFANSAIAPTPTGEGRGLAAAPVTKAAPPGYDEFVASEMNEEKHGTPIEMAKTAAEGLGTGLAGPIFTGAETAVLGNEKEQLARAEANPITHGAAEMTGLVGGSVFAPEATLGGMLTKVGAGAHAVAEAAGLGKIGSAVVRGAIENMVYQGQHEASRMLLKDPEQSANTAVASMGLAGLIGGAFGTIAPLWHATMGKQTGGVLGAVADKLGGIESVDASPGAKALAKSGMDVAPEMRTLVSDNPAVQQMARTLMQTDTNASGLAMQKSYKQMTNEASDHLLAAFGKTPKEIVGMPEVSSHANGTSIGKTLASEYEEQLNPFAKGFDEVKDKLKSIDLLPNTPEAHGTTNNIIDKITQKAIEEGWVTSPSSDIMKEVNRITKELPLQKNLKNLSDYITQVGNNTSGDVMNGPLKRAGAIMTGIMKEAEAEVMANKLGKIEGPEAVEQFKALREGYAVQSAMKEAIQDRLGAKGSTSGYANAIREMARTDGEGVLRKLSGKNDADWLGFIQRHYPKTAEAIRTHHIDQLLETAATKAKDGSVIDNATLLKNLQNMPKELRDFIASPEAQKNILGIGAALDAFKNPHHNFSNTARAGSSLLKDWAPTALATATALSGHSLPAAALVGVLGKTIGKEAPDAVRLALLRFLGSNQPIEAGAFKTMVEYIHHTIKGETLLSNATKNIFKAGSEVIPSHLMPKETDREKLKKAVNNLRDNPQDSMKMVGNTGHYLPAHATALSLTGANAAKMLNMAKPNTDRTAPLDTQRSANSAEKSQYNRTLDIMQQPLSVLKHISDGTLTPTDVATIKTAYPGLYARSVIKLTDHMTNAVAKGIVIPYKTKLGLSLYMGQALDSTMQPGSIMAAQPKPQQAQPQTPMQPASNPKRSTASLSKIPKLYQTTTQNAEQDRSGRK